MEAQPLVAERLRSVHPEMVEAVLAGDGLARVAELAAGAVGGAVAIVVPRHGATALYPPDALKATDLRSLEKGACLRGW